MLSFRTAPQSPSNKIPGKPGTALVSGTGVTKQIGLAWTFAQYAISWSRFLFSINRVENVIITL